MGNHKIIKDNHKCSKDNKKGMTCIMLLPFIWATSFDNYIKYCLTYHLNSFVWEIVMYISPHSSVKQRWFDQYSGHQPNFSHYMHCQNGFLAYLTRSVASALKIWLFSSNYAALMRETDSCLDPPVSACPAWWWGRHRRCCCECPEWPLRCRCHWWMKWRWHTRPWMAWGWAAHWGRWRNASTERSGSPWWQHRGVPTVDWEISTAGGSHL